MAIGLTKAGGEVTGIDLDSRMIEIAKKKALIKKVAVKFSVGDMMRLEEDFKARSFDMAVCLGNTLVHLQSAGAIEDFLRGVYNILKRNGKFISMSINYNRILNHNVKGLPTIDNAYIKFERKYKYSEKKTG